jgi:excisionase family DNA binding protein
VVSPSLLTYRDIAERLAVSVMTVRRMAARGELPLVRVGGLVRFEPAAVGA